MRPLHELQARYGEQIDWMRASAERFDAGVTSEAKRIATVIRTLVHNTSSSTSLLCQLGIQEEMRWVSAVSPLEEAATPSVDGLWVSVPNEPGFRPILGNYPYSMDFDGWWHKAVVVIEVGSLSRSDFILGSVNFDGGVHIDPRLPAAYESLSRRGGLEPLRINSAGRPYPDTSDPVPCAIRTIAGELYMSLREFGWA